MTKIPMTHGQVAVVDDVDAHLANYSWWAFRGTNTWYARGKVRLGPNQWAAVFLHHAVRGRPLGALQIDHKNGDGLDNRRENLRIVTPRINTINNARRRNGLTASRFPGVSFNRRKNRWYAMIRVAGTRRYLGCFQSEEKAAAAYQAAIR